MASMTLVTRTELSSETSGSKPSAAEHLLHLGRVRVDRVRLGVPADETEVVDERNPSGVVADARESISVGTSIVSFFRA